MKHCDTHLENGGTTSSWGKHRSFENEEYQSRRKTLCFHDSDGENKIVCFISRSPLEANEFSIETRIQ